MANHVGGAVQPRKLQAGGTVETATLSSECKSDLTQYCSSYSTSSDQLNCLYNNEGTISKRCLTYLETITPGGCNEDAQIYCADETKVSDIQSCLESHLSEVSTSCYINLMKYDNKLSMREIREQRMMLLISVISLIFLFFPSLIVLRCSWKINHLRKVEKIVLEEEGIEDNTNASPSAQQYARLSSTDDSMTGASITIWRKYGKDIIDVKYFHKESDHFQINNSSRKGSWCLSFHNLSYWAFEKKKWADVFKETKKSPILHQVRD